MPKRPNLKETGLRLVANARNAPQEHALHQLAADQGFLYIPVDLLRPNPDQPRQHFNNSALEDLSASIKEKGVLQPVLARKDSEGEGFILIAGERRWRAAKAAGLAEIPALIRKDEDTLEVALIENVQRENLNPLEEAEALLKLKLTKGFTDQELAKIIGKSRPSVTEILSLNQLPEPIKGQCRTSDTWSKSQLLQLVRANSPEKIDSLWKVLKGGAATTVRDLRRHMAKSTSSRKGKPIHYRFLHKPKGRSYQVLVTFTKAEVSREELRAALREALAHLP
jgi:ParB family transcriptional regulator, chromosome partitioning protein